jgi:hypothetical protein
LNQDEYEALRRRINYIFDHLADPPANDQPQFVFAHIAAPHPPFVFNSKGEPTVPQRALVLSADLEFALRMSDSEYMNS